MIAPDPQADPQGDLWEASWGGLSEQEGLDVPSGRPRMPERYEWRDELGRGGMGAVHAVFDTVLGREVALKLVGSIRGQEGQRALREARLTARLEHPSIVSIYDAGESPDGVGYYIMPVLRGRSLAALLATGEDKPEGFALVRMLLAVCEAMAYAHERAIVHRDLKPANIMVGEFGETQVLDWGLAAEEGDRAAPMKVGTRGYSSPEQLEGAVAHATADVYALGAVLRRILRTLPEAPEDLQAIAEKAQATDVSRRYEDARAMARDLQRFLDGALVSARTYSSWALASRFFRTYWKGVALGLGVVFALGVAGAVSYWRIDAARQASLVAERATQEALDEQSQTFGWALESHALLELERDSFAEAELLALAALERGESSRARGILMRTHAGPRPMVTVRSTMRDCRSVDFDFEGEVCLRDGKVSYYAADSGEPRWTVEAEVAEAGLGRDVVALVQPGAVMFLDRSTGERLSSAADPGRFKRFVYSTGGKVGAVLGAGVFINVDGEARRIGSCGADTLAISLGEDGVSTLCRDGKLVVWDEADEALASHQLPLDRFAGTVFSLASDPEGRYVMGTVEGELVRFDPRNSALEGPWPVANRAVWRVESVSGGHTLVVADGGATATVVDAATGVVRFSLPRGVSGIRSRDGVIVASAGRRRLEWREPRAGRPSTFRAPSGLSSANFDAVGHRLALARGDGRVSFHDLETGESLGESWVANGVVKRVVFNEGGDVFAAVAGMPGGYLISTDDTRPADQPIAYPMGLDFALRRAVGTSLDGEMVVLATPYGGGLFVVDGEGQTTLVDGPRFTDLTVSHSGETVVALARDGSSFAFDGGLTEVGTVPFAKTVAVDDAGARVVAAPGRLVLSDSDGERETSLDQDVEDLAFSPDGRFVVGGTVQGEVLVWNRSLELVAQVAEARDRVAWVGFAPDGRMAAAGWDGTLRLYDLGVLGKTTTQLLEDARASWGVELPEVFDRALR